MKIDNIVRLNFTIQRDDKLNSIFYKDEQGPGNGRHNYIIYSNENYENPIAEINFQCGARNEIGSTCGILDEDLLEIVRHRLTCFQQGEYPSRETACALTHVEEALLWLNKRKCDRKERGVLGKHIK